MANILKQLETLRNEVNAKNSDDTRLALVGLYAVDKIDFNEWIDVLDRNNNYKIQNSGVFCEELENAIKDGASKKYQKYVDYVNDLGTEFFAPKWIGGLQNALKLEINSVILDLQAKRPKKKSVKATLTKMYRYYKKTGKVYRPAKAKNKPQRIVPDGYGKLHALGLEDQMTTKIRRITHHIKHPRHISDVQEVIDFLNDKLSKNNLAEVWGAVQKSIYNLRTHMNNSDLIQFVRNGNLVDNEDGSYSVTGDDSKKSYTVTDLRKDLKRTDKDFQKIANWFVSKRERQQEHNHMNRKQQLHSAGFRDTSTKTVNKAIDKVESKYPKLRAKTNWCPMTFYSVLSNYTMPVVKELAKKIPNDPIIGTKKEYEWDKIVKGHKLTDKQRTARRKKHSSTDFSKIPVMKAPKKIKQLSLI